MTLIKKRLRPGDAAAEAIMNHNAQWTPIAACAGVLCCPTSDQGPEGLTLVGPACR